MIKGRMGAIFGLLLCAGIFSYLIKRRAAPAGFGRDNPELTRNIFDRAHNLTRQRDRRAFSRLKRNRARLKADGPHIALNIGLKPDLRIGNGIDQILNRVEHDR